MDFETRRSERIDAPEIEGIPAIAADKAAIRPAAALDGLAYPSASLTDLDSVGLEMPTAWQVSS